MKILYLNPSGELGGAERSLLFLMASLRAAKPEWQMQLVAGSDGPLIRRAREIGVQASAMDFPVALSRLGDAGAGGPAGRQQSHLRLVGNVGRAGVPSIAYVRRLRRTLARLAPDLIHSNGFKMHVLAAWARPAGCPLIWHIRDYVSARPLMSRLIRANANRCTAAIANSNSVAEDLRSVCGDKLRIHRVYNGVDLNAFSPRGSIANLDQMCAMTPAAPNTIGVGLIATMARWKGHQVFLRAVAKASRVLPIRAYVIGAPIYKNESSQYQIDELRRMAAELDIEKIVGFTGFVDDSAAAIRALDIVVHASTQPEPFGLAIAEGMACGKPVIVSAAGGASEIVTPGVDALAHPPGEVDALADCIEKLAGDCGLRDRIGAAARASAERQFSRERVIAEMLPIYQGVARAAA
ncbi:MAG: glycosyltransferase family 4 protein [Candidatus Binatus sp.]|uniref:glycosyltransferase family 4 protein n=1 Tax=Candidatus Binatus sp. TaxID=2811406 RepID=UPI003BAF008F